MSEQETKVNRRAKIMRSFLNWFSYLNGIGVEGGSGIVVPLLPDVSFS